MNKVGSTRREIAQRLEESARVKKTIAKSRIGEIERMVKFIITALHIRQAVRWFYLVMEAVPLMLSTLLVSWWDNLRSKDRLFQL